MHALTHCSHAKGFWDEAQRWFDFKLPRLHPETWAQDILCDPMFTDQVRAKIVSVMWIIWHSRNKQTHDEEGPNPANALKIIQENLALLELPKEKALALPGNGWRPLMVLV